MKTIIRVLRYLGVILIVLIAIGAIYQWQAARIDRDQHPPPGTLHTVDNLALHLDCRGSGEPTVVLEAGLNSGSSSWGLIHEPLRRITRVCAWDRPGMDWSEPASEPVDAGTNATRLNALLNAAGINGPQIIVGMSAGGVFVREYYRRFPQNIVGMVLVDSSHEQQGQRLPAMDAAMDFESVLFLCSMLQPIGLIRALDMLDPFLNQFNVPPEFTEVTTANAYQSHTCRSMLLEARGFNSEIVDADPPASLGDLPLIVLSQGKAPEANETFGMSLADAQGLAVAWNELQNELTMLSSRGSRQIATRSGHVIQLEQPEIVIEAITSMIKDLRDTSLIGSP